MIAKNYKLNYNKVNGILPNNNNNKILEFEEELNKYISSKEVYVVPTSSCSHSLKLLLILNSYHNDTSKVFKNMEIPNYTYLSVLLNLNYPIINQDITYNKWNGYYQILNTNIFDSAQCLKENLFDEINEIDINPFVCLSFGHSKPLDIKKGGAIVFLKNEENEEVYHILKRLSHDGRDSSIPASEDTLLTDFDNKIIGEHYNFVPLQAENALIKLNYLKENPKEVFVGYENYPELLKLNKGK